ncbi:hypothetical protein [Shinella sp. JR1-6]|uniref:hypothetical protein n=1 Tax=Shinella sp. JR1-6 TaxID=2527671 RepID=UPI00140491DF|nr:hypothetical protein [Shinella sp. JR1-6]
MKKLVDKIREHLATILVTIAGLLVLMQIAAGFIGDVVIGCMLVGLVWAAQRVAPKG